MLKAMSSRVTWKEILENEEDKKKIEESFKRIDECTKDFQVRESCIPSYELAYLLLPALHQHEHQPK
jgi:hypothetical protein